MVPHAEWLAIINRAAQLLAIHQAPAAGEAALTVPGAEWLFSDPAFVAFDTVVPAPVLGTPGSFVVPPGGTPSVALVLAEATPGSVPTWTTCQRVMQADRTAWLDEKKSGTADRRLIAGIGSAISSSSAVVARPLFREV